MNHLKLSAHLSQLASPPFHTRPLLRPPPGDRLAALHTSLVTPGHTWPHLVTPDHTESYWVTPPPHPQVTAWPPCTPASRCLLQ